MSERTYSEIVADYGADLRFEALPEAVIEQAKLSTLDWLGVAIAAHRTPSSEVIVDYARSMGGTPEATVVGHGDRFPMAVAALVNGTMSHSIELDDHEAHERSYVHPSVVVMPALWAAAETARPSGREFLAGVVLGYEVMGRLSAATPSGYMDFEKGFHTTALFGPFAAASVAARVLGLTPAQTTNAIGIIGSLCSGLFETRAAGTWTKRLHAGWGAQNGIVAAQLARRGFTGPRTILEGKHGLYRAFAGDGHYDLDIITDKLGETYEIELIMYKPYACAGVLHSPLTAVDEIRSKVDIQPENVRSVLVESARKLVDHFTVPRELKYRPNSGAQGQFSLPYAVAVLIHDGAALLGQFTDEAVSRPSVIDLASRIEARFDAELDARWPKEEPSRVTIELTDGSRHTAEVPGGKGTTVYPMTTQELQDKFRLLATPYVGADTAERLLERVMDLDSADDVGAILGLTRAAVAAGGDGHRPQRTAPVIAR